MRQKLRAEIKKVPLILGPSTRPKFLQMEEELPKSPHQDLVLIQLIFRLNSFCENSEY